MTTTICIDANFVILMLSLQGIESAYERYWNQWQEDNCELVAPTLFGYEIANAFHRAAKAGQITAKEAQSLLETALNLGINFYSDDELHVQALKIAQHLNLSACYDAHYLALAQRLGV
jgi:predicted nucleic acid-binding protein